MNFDYALHQSDEFALHRWNERAELAETGSIETIAQPIDKYEISHFASEDFPRFIQCVNCLSPRDAEIMLCYAILQKRPTDLSVLFGKAGHRAEEDLHKAAHKLAGLIEFGPQPEIKTIERILSQHNICDFAGHSFATCLWQYARSRDFADLAKLLGTHGLRQQMLRVFKQLHASEGREAGLLAGWILWLVDGSNPQGHGWRPRKRTGREYRLGPTVFHTPAPRVEELNPRATGRGGKGQRPDTVKIQRKIKFLLRGMNG